MRPSDLAELNAKLAAVVTDRVYLATRHAVALLETQKPDIQHLSDEAMKRYVEALTALDRLVDAVRSD